eukprot:1133671-Pelagomonas_calceolata.AAC.18
MKSKNQGCFHCCSIACLSLLQCLCQSSGGSSGHVIEVLACYRSHFICYVTSSDALKGIAQRLWAPDRPFVSSIASASGRRCKEFTLEAGSNEVAPAFLSQNKRRLNPVIASFNTMEILYNVTEACGVRVIYELERIRQGKLLPSKPKTFLTNFKKGCPCKVSPSTRSSTRLSPSNPPLQSAWASWRREGFRPGKVSEGSGVCVCACVCVYACVRVWRASL